MSILNEKMSVTSPESQICHSQELAPPLPQPAPPLHVNRTINCSGRIFSCRQCSVGQVDVINVKITRFTTAASSLTSVKQVFPRV